ncbi:hypothetical protein JTB14_037523 [Gonioctena quinquepunctata]|nr:hypothetical protein JTB14_037523 [Gonioctena quinquepunctata]
MKKRDAIKSGAGRDDVNKSKWFCYSSMLFLKDRNQPRGMTDAHTQDQQTSDENVEVAQEETQNVDQEPLEDSGVTSGSGEKGSKRKLFESPSARSHLQKKHKFSATEGALSIMKDVQVRNALKDQYTAFGDQVGMRIRNLPTSKARQIVKHPISHILFEVEMDKYGNPNSVNTTYSHPFYNISHFSQSPFSSPVVPGNIRSDPPHPQQRSYSGQMPTTIQAPRRLVHMRLLTVILWIVF